MTIEEVMRLAHQAAQEHATLLNWRRLEAALQALVAQARDDALEECEEICVAQGVEWDSDAQVTNKNYADHCAFLIRARIAARKVTP